jgi:hypothetical protein
LTLLLGRIVNANEFAIRILNDSTFSVNFMLIANIGIVWCRTVCIQCIY